MNNHKTQPQSFDAWLAEIGVDATALSPGDNAALHVSHEALRPTVTAAAAIVARHRAGIIGDLTAHARQGDDNDRL